MSASRTREIVRNVKETAAVVLVTESHRILLLRRSMDDDVCPGRWGLIVEHGEHDRRRYTETMLETAVRGVKEEAGIQREVIAIGEIGNGDNHRYGFEDVSGRHHEEVVNFYIAFALDHTQIALSREHESAEEMSIGSCGA